MIGSVPSGERRRRLASQVTAVGEKATSPFGGIPLRVYHLTEVDLSRRWRISPRTLQSWRWKRVGPPWIKAMGRVLYRVSDIETFEAEHVRGGR